MVISFWYFRADEILEHLRAIREAIDLPRDEISETLRAMRETIARDIADLPPGTPASSLAVIDLYDYLRHKHEQAAPVSGSANSLTRRKT
jgi:hypothetical protein